MYRDNASGQFILPAGQFGIIAAAHESIEPAEVHQSQASFQRAGPVDAKSRRIVITPVLQPELGDADRMHITIQCAVHRHAGHFAPAIDLPDCPSIGIVLEVAMIQLSRGDVRINDDTECRIAVPAWWCPYFDGLPAKQFPFAAYQLFSICGQLFAQFGGDTIAPGQLGNIGECAVPWSARNAPKTRNFASPSQALSHATADLAHTHRAQALHVPAQAHDKAMLRPSRIDSSTANVRSML